MHEAAWLWDRKPWRYKGPPCWYIRATPTVNILAARKKCSSAKCDLRPLESAHSAYIVKYDKVA